MKIASLEADFNKLLYIFVIYMKGILDNCTGFEWDKGNSFKNWVRHRVAQGECEQVFFNELLIVYDDVKHSVNEKRWFLLGKTDVGRFMFIVFTVRKDRIRIISARYMNKKEKQMYNEQA